MPNFSLITQEFSLELGRYIDPVPPPPVDCVWIEMIINEFPTEAEIVGQYSLLTDYEGYATMTFVQPDGPEEP